MWGRKVDDKFVHAILAKHYAMKIYWGVEV
jgi:hypothetical protein